MTRGFSCGAVPVVESYATQVLELNLRGGGVVMMALPGVGQGLEPS